MAIPTRPVVAFCASLAVTVIALVVAATQRPDHSDAGRCPWRCAFASLASACILVGVLCSIGLVAHLIGAHSEAIRELREKASAAARSGRANTACRFCLTRGVWELRFYFRLALLTPLYALVLVPSLLWPRPGLDSINDAFQNTVEAYVAYTYWGLLVLYAGGYQRLRTDWPRFLLARKEAVEDLVGPAWVVEHRHDLHHEQKTSGVEESVMANAQLLYDNVESDSGDGAGDDAAKASAYDLDLPPTSCRMCCRDQPCPKVSVEDVAQDAELDEIINHPRLSAQRRGFLARGGRRVARFGRRANLAYLSANVWIFLPLITVCGLLSSETGEWLWNDHTGSYDRPSRAYYVPGEVDLKNMSVYVYVIRALFLGASLFMIVLGIVTLKRTAMHRDKLLATKFVTVKAVVFLGAWQRIGVSFSAKLHGLSYWAQAATALPDAFPEVRDALEHLGQAYPEWLIEASMMAIEMLPIAVVSCFVFRKSTQLWPASSSCGDASGDKQATTSPIGNAAAEECHVDALFDDIVRENLCGTTSVLCAGDILQDIVFFRGLREGYELPAARRGNAVLS